MKLVIIAAIMVALLATPAVALEDGVTFHDGGTCTEADGTQGLSQADGECITPADYDILFGFENLSTVPLLYDPSVTVAAQYDIGPEAPASTRLIGVGLVAEPTTYLAIVNGWKLY